MTEEGGESRRGGLFSALTLAAFAAVLFALVPGAAAGTPGATITVTTTADSTGGPGCSLRNAITAANTDTATGGCSAGNGADTIVFSVSGQISLGATLPAVTSAVTIDGSGQDIAVSGQGSVRVLEVSPGASLTARELAIVDGLAANAGGILNDGTLLLVHDTLSGDTTSGDAGKGAGVWTRTGATLIVRDSSFSADGNPYSTFGGGIHNDGLALVASSSFSNNNCAAGCAISNDGSLSVRASDFSNNFADGGGGAILNVGTLTLTASTVSGNGAAGGLGGGIGNWGTMSVKGTTFYRNGAGTEGGAIENGYLAGRASVVNSTFSENGAEDGGGIENGGSLTLVNSTLSGNHAAWGGAISSRAQATFKNVIVAGSTGGNCVGGVNVGSTSNLSDDSTCGPGFTQVSLAALNLGPLGDYGGPTQTIALGPGSVAIDAGDNAAAECLLTDQRGPGYPRIVNGRVDIGAFEVQRPQPASRKTTCLGSRSRANP